MIERFNEEGARLIGTMVFRRYFTLPEGDPELIYDGFQMKYWDIHDIPTRFIFEVCYEEGVYNPDLACMVIRIGEVRIGSRVDRTDAIALAEQVMNLFPEFPEPVLESEEVVL